MLHSKGNKEKGTHMKFEYSQKLKDYMDKKGLRDVMVYLQEPSG